MYAQAHAADITIVRSTLTCSKDAVQCNGPKSVLTHGRMAEEKTNSGQSTMVEPIAVACQ